MNHKLLYLALTIYYFANASNLVYSQSNRANISFSKTEYNFGKIKEENGAAETSFEFINTGGEPLIIGNVAASCGCTTPSWSKTPIPPGGKGFIKASYNPIGRPGIFSKLITVTSNAENSPSRLTITGIVIQREKSVEDIYPIKIGDLRLTTDKVAFTPILNTESKSEKIDILNVGTVSISISFEQLPKHIKAIAEPIKINPQEKGKITITYDASIAKEWEYTTDNFFLKLNDQNSSNNRISVTAMIKEDFTKLSAKELNNAPIAVVENKTFEFGTIKQGEKVNHEFILQNQGKSNLIIRTTKSSCGCTAISPKENLILPGKSTSIKVIFDSKDKTGTQDKTVTIITNDPKNSVIVLWLKGNVEEQK